MAAGPEGFAGLAAASGLLSTRLMATSVKLRAGFVVLLGLGTVVMALLFPAGTEPWIAPRPRARLPQDPVPARRLDAEKLAQLTGITLGSGRRVAAPRPTEPTKLPLRARGTLLGAPVDWAAIENTATGKMSSYAVGDVVLGARVLAISRSLVTLAEDSRVTYLEVSGLDRLIAAPPPAPREVSAGHFEVSRRELEHELSSLSELAREVRVVPSGRGGFTVFAIRPGSLAEKVGLKNGDRLTSVNGQALDSPETVLGLYSDLKTAPHVELELERAGAMVRQSYELQ